MRRAGRRLVPDSCKFTLSLTEGCLAAIVAALGEGGAQVGGAFTLDATLVATGGGGGGGGGEPWAVQGDRDFGLQVLIL